MSLSLRRPASEHFLEAALHLSPLFRDGQKIPKPFSFHFFQREPRQLLSGAIELKDASFPVQNDDQQILGRVQDRRDELLFPLRPLVALLQLVNIHEHHQNAIDFALRRQERENTDRIPSAVVGLHLAPNIAQPLDDLRDRFIHVREG